jgi:hypothetical protein
MSATKKRLGELLIDAGVIDATQLQAALGHQRQWGVRLGQALVDLKLASEPDIVQALAIKFGYEVAQLEALEPYGLEQALKLVPREFAVRNNVFPMAADTGSITVAMSDPTNLAVVDELRFRTGRRVKVCIGGDQEIGGALAARYPSDRAQPEAIALDLDLDEGPDGVAVFDPFGGGSKDALEAFFGSGEATPEAGATAAPEGPSRAPPPASPPPRPAPPARVAAPVRPASPAAAAPPVAAPARPAPARPSPAARPPAPMAGAPAPGAPAAPRPTPPTTRAPPGPGETGAPAAPRPAPPAARAALAAGSVPANPPAPPAAQQAPRTAAASVPPSPVARRAEVPGEAILATDLLAEEEMVEGRSRPRGLTDDDVQILEAIERLAGGAHAEPDIVKPAQAMAAVIRLLIQKRIITEEEFLDALRPKG